MELLSDKVFNTFYFKNANISFNEKLLAIVIGLSPFLIVCLYFFNKYFLLGFK